MDLVCSNLQVEWGALASVILWLASRLWLLAVTTDVMPQAAHIRSWQLV